MSGPGSPFWSVSSKDGVLEWHASAEYSDFRMPLRERDKFSSFLFLWKSAGFCLHHLLCTSQFKIKSLCCNFNIKHIPKTPHTGLLAVFSTQSVSPITVMVWENLFLAAVRPGSFSKARAYKGRIERPKGMVGHIQLTVLCACGAGMYFLDEFRRTYLEITFIY